MAVSLNSSEKISVRRACCTTTSWVVVSCFNPPEKIALNGQGATVRIFTLIPSKKVIATGLAVLGEARSGEGEQSCSGDANGFENSVHGVRCEL